MSGSAADREPGIPLENGKEEASGPNITCAGDNSKHVSYQTELSTERNYNSDSRCINMVYLL